MPKKIETDELKEARDKLADVGNKLAANLARQAEIIAARRDREIAEDDILVRASAFLNGDQAVVDIQAEAAELGKLAAEERVLRRAAQIQAGRVDELVLTASREEYTRRKPEVIELIRRMIDAVFDYQKASEDYAKLQAEFQNKGLRAMIPNFGWPGLTPASIENVKSAVRFGLQQAGLEEALKKEGR